MTHRHHLIAAATLTLAFGTAVHAQSDAYEFKGIALGAALSEVKSSGRFACRAENSAAADTVCFIGRDETIAGAKVRSLLLNFFGEKLAAIHISFAEVDFAQVAAAFIEKYGAPRSDTTNVVTNRMGAKFDNRELSWANASGTIRLTQRASEISISSAAYLGADTLDTFRRRQQERRTTNAKDL